MKLGWIVKRGNGGKSCPSNYYFKIPVIISETSETNLVTVAEPVTVTVIARGKKEISKEIDIVNDCTKDFDQFWNIYPRKVNKTDALNAWTKLKPDPLLFEQIVTAVKISATENPQWIQQDGRFIPHPATYLNNRRWEDEFPTMKAKGIKNNHAKGYVNAINQKQTRNRRDHGSFIDDALNEFIINQFGFEANDDDISTF